MVLPDRLRCLRGEANLVEDRAVVPRLADAKSIHVADPHVGNHLRRRHDDRLHIVERMDAVRRQPVIEPHRVRAGRECLRERVLALLAIDQRLEFRAVGRAFFLQLTRQRDRLAVVVEIHQHGHVLLRTADAHLHAVDQAVQNMRRIELPVDELVAHARPGCFLARHDLDAVLLVELHHRRNHHRRAISQRNEADFDFGFLGSVGACCPHAGAQCRIDQRHQRTCDAGGKHAPALLRQRIRGGSRFGAATLLALRPVHGHFDSSFVMAKQKRRWRRRSLNANPGHATPLSKSHRRRWRRNQKPLKSSGLR